MLRTGFSATNWFYMAVLNKKQPRWFQQGCKGKDFSENGLYWKSSGFKVPRHSLPALFGTLDGILLALCPFGLGQKPDWR